MEPRRVNGKNHWYHETQSTICPVDVLPLVPEAAHVEDRFLLDLTLPAAWLRAHADWLHPARQLCSNLSAGISGEVVHVDGGFNIAAMNELELK